MSTHSLVSARPWFDAALERSPETRLHWLESHCPDTRIQRVVRALLGVQDHGVPLDRSLGEAVQALGEPQARTPT